jgi:hypothetical protein
MNCFKICFNFAVNFNLRRYNKAARRVAGSEVRARQRALAGSVKALASSIGPPPRGPALHRYERVLFTNLTAEAGAYTLSLSIST